MGTASIWFGFFFFQAEDGIRDKLVTGVQTCALPIYRHGEVRGPARPRRAVWGVARFRVRGADGHRVPGGSGGAAPPPLPVDAAVRREPGGGLRAGGDADSGRRGGRRARARRPPARADAAPRGALPP